MVILSFISIIGCQKVENEPISDKNIENTENDKSEIVHFKLNRYFRIKRVFMVLGKSENNLNYISEQQKPSEDSKKNNENINTEIIKPEKRPNEIPVVEKPSNIVHEDFTPNEGQNIQKPSVPSENNKIQGNEKELEAYWNNIDEITECAQGYYNEYFNKTRLITQNGFFYNKAANTYVDLNFLCDNEGLHYRYKNIEADVLLMNPADLAVYKELSIKSSEIEKGLTVFAAIKHPSQNSYLIGSLESRGGILSDAQYNELLSKYSQSHGAVRRLYADTNEYQRILNFICMYEGRYDTFAVRSVTVDDKYAMVVLSSAQNTADVKQYILVKDGSLWEVGMDGLENEPRVIVAINKKFPDFNISMIPQYTINDFKKSIKTNFNDVYHLLITLNQISSIDDIKYIAGTDKYCFIVCNNETKFLLTAKDGTWIIDKILSTDDAKRQMENNDYSAPTFIILDN